MPETRNELLYSDEVYAIIGCAMEVLNTLGSGLLEKPYENALCVEMNLRGIPYVQQPRYPVFYKGTHVGEYVPDAVAYDIIIVETKAVEKLGDIEMAQMINYLKVTGLKVGLLLNFKHSTLEYKRVVL